MYNKISIVKFFVGQIFRYLTQKQCFGPFCGPSSAGLINAEVVNLVFLIEEVSYFQTAV